jgi:eukaryotic-like serine/threonine-protein kinase
MSLAPGVRLGPYEVLARIGEGGMGTVWRARHVTLKRDDALKVLPDALHRISTGSPGSSANARCWPR